MSPPPRWSSTPGRAIINGNNLENGRERIDRILPIALEHGAAVLSMTIDEEGMAHGRAQKLAVAQRIAQIACDEYGLRAEDLIFDTLTFPLTTGQAELRDSALETIEGLRLIKQRLPGTLTALGISNVSFGVGMAARGVLNSVFLWHAVQAGLDMAIVNPAHITPLAEIPQEQRALAEDLIFNRDEDALARYIQFFEQNEVRPAGQEVEDPTADMSSEEALHWHIVHRRKDGLEALIDDCLLRQDAVGVLNKVLLPAMKEVGDKFGAGELILPFVLQSAEAMKRAVAWLEQYMERLDDAGKGTVLLATVYGDVHDIGKNLVKTILGNNGYTVHDLGKQVPANTIIDQAQALGADAIGLSALLVSTSKQMPLIVNELARRGLAFPVLIGGAAINRRFGHRILFLEDDDQPYAPGVFYCRDAFEGLAVMDDLVDPARRAELVAQRVADARAGRARPAAGRAQPGPARAGNVPPAPHIPQPPFFGAKTIESLPLEIVLRHIHRPELFRLSWGAKNTRGEEWTQLEADFTARLETMSRQALRPALPAPAGRLRLLPGQQRGRRPHPLGARNTGDRPAQRAGALPLSAPTPRRASLPRRLLRPGQWRPGRYHRAAGRYCRRRGHGDGRRPAGGRRIQRGLVLPRPRGAGGRGHGRLCAPAHRARAGHPAAAGQTLQLGLPCLPRAGRPRDAAAPAAGARRPWACS